uniref:Uncharacterized protein LOC108038674 n=1 Tax=Drosophila rhopaloa TaxID=1041015 RepID=A0A6P4DZK6_DRORH
MRRSRGFLCLTFSYQAEASNSAQGTMSPAYMTRFAQGLTRITRTNAAVTPARRTRSAEISGRKFNRSPTVMPKYRHLSTYGRSAPANRTGGRLLREKNSFQQHNCRLAGRHTHSDFCSPSSHDVHQLCTLLLDQLPALPFDKE